MSHTTEWSGKCWPRERHYRDQEREATITMHHDGDPKGSNVEFWLPNWIADAAHHHGAGPNQEGMVSVHIPFDALKYLVLNYLRNEMVNQLEQADENELMLLIGPVLHAELRKLVGLDG